MFIFPSLDELNERQIGEVLTCLTSSKEGKINIKS
jgi:hypothetical protein